MKCLLQPLAGYVCDQFFGFFGGGFAPTPVGPVDLTAEGGLDWAHWGLSTATDFNHKSGVSPQISNITVMIRLALNRGTTR